MVLFDCFGKLEHGLDASDFEIQIQTVRQQDQHSFTERLCQTAQNAKTMLNALGVKDHEYGIGQYAMLDLAATLSKVLPVSYSVNSESYFHCQRAADFPSTTPDTEHQFVQKAADVLCHLSKRTVSDKLPSWFLNSLEVSYNADQKSLLGYGGFGSVYQGEWNGLVFLAFMEK